MNYTNSPISHDKAKELMGLATEYRLHVLRVWGALGKGRKPF